MKTIKSLIAIFFLLIGSQAFAQTGTTPYVGSTHIYYVNSSDGNTLNAGHPDNTYYWYLTDNTEALVTDTDVFTVGQAWGTDVAPVNNLFKVDITWGSAASGTYYLYVKEYSNHGCISKRRIEILVKPNAFDIQIAAVAADGCNTASGTLFTGVTPVAAQLGSTPRDFNITMTGTPNSWKFKPVVTADNTAAITTTTYNYDNAGVETPLTVIDDYITVPAGVNAVVATSSVTNVWNDNNTIITFNIDAGEDVLYGTLEKDESKATPDQYAGTATSIVWPVPTTTEIQTN